MDKRIIDESADKTPGLCLNCAAKYGQRFKLEGVTTSNIKRKEKQLQQLRDKVQYYAQRNVLAICKLE